MKKNQHLKGIAATAALFVLIVLTAMQIGNGMQTEESQKKAFAPEDEDVLIANDTEAEGTSEDAFLFTKGYLGIWGMEVSADYVTEYGYPEGVFVTKVYRKSPAETGGMEVGDVIISVDGTKIDDWEDFNNQMSKYSSGSQVEIVLERWNNEAYQKRIIHVILT